MKPEFPAWKRKYKYCEPIHSSVNIRSGNESSLNFVNSENIFYEKNSTHHYLRTFICPGFFPAI